MCDEMIGAGYVVLILAHALCAIVGFGALAATGAYAQAVRAAGDPFASETLRRFFRPGHNLAAASILAVPVLGAWLLIAQHGQDAHLAYPWIGLGCWSIAAVVAATVIWPAEHRLQLLLDADASPHAMPGAEDRAMLDALANRCFKGATVTTVCFVVAVVVMLAQP
jgi:putative copper export protein